MEARQREQLGEWLLRIREELDRVMQFWFDHSHDSKHGGFFTCLDEDGNVFDETKHIWLQARQVWMYMRLRNEVERYKNNKQLYHAAVEGAEFLLKNCWVKKGGCMRCPLSTTKEGKAIKFQRALFTECFFTMAMSEMWRGTGEKKYYESSVTTMLQIRTWCMEDSSALGRDILPGSPSTSSLATPMMALCLCKQMEECNIKWCEDDSFRNWAVEEIQLHVQRNKTTILENVSCSGEELPGSFGRLQNPGHAIECGWFLLQHYESLDNKLMCNKTIDCFIDGPFRQGWDKKYNGLLYFIDADNFPPTQLEWNMKLWWPHNEAMIAFLMAFKHTKSEEHFNKFLNVAQYSFDKFSDPKHGEWYGYLMQKGEISSRFKGGPWKGCFHVPRCLYMCEKIIQILLN